MGNPCGRRHRTTDVGSTTLRSSPLRCRRLNVAAHLDRNPGLGIHGLDAGVRRSAPSRRAHRRLRHPQAHVRGGTHRVGRRVRARRTAVNRAMLFGARASKVRLPPSWPRPALGSSTPRSRTTRPTATASSIATNGPFSGVRWARPRLLGCVRRRVGPAGLAAVAAAVLVRDRPPATSAVTGDPALAAG
jgi:hypothetical protein